MWAQESSFSLSPALGLRCCMQASRCGGFSCCGAQALGAQASGVNSTWVQ